MLLSYFRLKPSSERLNNNEVMVLKFLVQNISLSTLKLNHKLSFNSFNFHILYTHIKNSQQLACYYTKPIIQPHYTAKVYLCQISATKAIFAIIHAQAFAQPTT